MLNELSAVALLKAYARKELSPVEVMRAVIARVEATEPKIHATYLFAPERALAEARASEARWSRGEPMGALDGVPATVKDNIATAGEPKPLGTAASLLDPEPSDAPPAARLREAGAILFAKTTMPDYGMLSSGLSSFHPLTRNPWKLDRNPGGSSAGAGAAAAAGYGPLHVGTDIGGSVRLPAGWCGIFGLKPSAGRIPIDPPYIGRVAGPMTRSVADACLMMATLSKPDARDYMSLEPQTLAWPTKPKSLKGLRIGLLSEAGCGRKPTAEVRDAVQRAARDFEAAGALIEPVGPFLTQDNLDGLDRFWRTRSLIDLRELPEERRRKSSAIHSRMGGIGRGLRRRNRVSRLQSDRRDEAQGGRRRSSRSISSSRRRRRSPPFPPNLPRRATIRSIPFPISASPSPSTCPSSPPPRSTAATRPRACRSACRSSGAASMTSACLASRLAFEEMRANEARRWPEP